MKNNPQALVRELFRDPAHRQAVELIMRYWPNMGNLVRNHLLPEVQAQLARLKPGQRPESVELAHAFPAHHPKEITFQVPGSDELFPAGFGRATFMLVSTVDQPKIGDQFRFMLMINTADCQSSTARRKFFYAALLKAKIFPKGQANLPEWGPWVALWAKEQAYTLQDLDEKDAAGLAQLLVSGIKATYAPLTNYLKKHVAAR